MALVGMILKYIHQEENNIMLIFVKKGIKVFTLFIIITITILLIIFSLYRNCDSCAFWLDRQTLLNSFNAPIPHYDTVKMLDNDSMDYSVYLFEDVKNWERNFKPNWHSCKVIFNKDMRFDIPYKQYIHSNASKLFLVSDSKISFIYVKKGKNVYMITLSLGAGPANNVSTKIKILSDICGIKDL